MENKSPICAKVEGLGMCKMQTDVNPSVKPNNQKAQQGWDMKSAAWGRDVKSAGAEGP